MRGSVRIAAGRYFGFVPLDSLQRAKAVWVWKCD
jgi:hypothetical protein